MFSYSIDESQWLAIRKDPRSVRRLKTGHLVVLDEIGEIRGESLQVCRNNHTALARMREAPRTTRHILHTALGGQRQCEIDKCIPDVASAFRVDRQMQHVTVAKVAILMEFLKEGLRIVTGRNVFDHQSDDITVQRSLLAITFTP